MNRDRGIGYCGLACALCEEITDCVGCKQGGCPSKGQCKNYNCCNEKGYDNCCECDDFPCFDTILHKVRVRAFCRFIQMYGEDKLLNCLQQKEISGVKYHKDGQHYGDYDCFDSEQEIIDFILDKKS